MKYILIFLKSFLYSIISFICYMFLGILLTFLCGVGTVLAIPICFVCWLIFLFTGEE